MKIVPFQTKEKKIMKISYQMSMEITINKINSWPINNFPSKHMVATLNVSSPNNVLVFNFVGYIQHLTHFFASI